MEVIRAMQPDMFVALADEVGGSRGSGRFRVRVPKPQPAWQLSVG